MEQEKNYCVYMHKNKINGKVYIGITGQIPEKRWKDGNGYLYNTHFSHSIQKYGWENFDHIIIADKITKRNAEQLEIELIQLYESTDPNKGYNIQRGGNLSGSKYVYQYNRKTGLFIKKWESTIQIEKELHISNSDVSAVCLGKAKTCNGYYFSYTDHGEKIPKKIYDWINRNECSVKVAQYTLNGEFIKIYNYLADASNSANNNSNQRINFNNKTSFGYIWKKVTEKNFDYTKNLSQEEVEAHKPVDILSKECFQYDLNGNFLKSYSSTTEAACSIGQPQLQTCIAQCCRGEYKTCHNYYWRYAECYKYGENLSQQELKEMRSYNGTTGVYQYDLNGNFIEFYPSITAAAKKYKTGTSNISKVCKGQLKKTKGFIWRYSYCTFSKEELDEINLNKKKRKVVQYDVENNILNIFDSVIEASRKTGTNASSIVSCCNGNYHYGNHYKWKYA